MSRRIIAYRLYPAGREKLLIAYKLLRLQMDTGGIVLFTTESSEAPREDG